MEANKIMIGDKVAVRSNNGYDTFTLTVSEVKENGISSGNHRIFFAYDEIETIPLTAEILQKNGFKLTEIPDEYYDGFEPSRFWEYSTDKKGCLNINIKIDENVNTSIDVHNGDGVQMLQYFTDKNILYIHELQHSLRLVGLNEVADNFKV